MGNTHLQHLRKVIDCADLKYYNDDPHGTVLTDEQYDALKAELKKLAPDDQRHKRVGPPSLSKMLSKVSHQCFMGSLNKSDAVDDVVKWYDRMLSEDPTSKRVVASLKADGGSVALYYTNGVLTKAVTRGDGDIGEDITSNAYRFKNVPTQIDCNTNVAVRGEVVLCVDDWDKIDPERSSNPRNLGNGIMRRLDGYNANKLTFIAFDIDVGDCVSDRLQHLTELGFSTIRNTVANDISVALRWYDAICEERQSLPFWIDGVVFRMDSIELEDRLGYRDKRPYTQTVLKFEAEGVETTLLDVVLTVGHTGAIIPTGKVAPVRIGGTTVSSVLLNNFQMINDLDLAVGDTVYIVKAKDIIPKIISVVNRPDNRTTIEEPSKCPVCGYAAGRRIIGAKSVNDGAITECKNPDCPAQAVARLKTWINKLNILGIGDEVLAALMDKLDAKTPVDLYRIATDPAKLSLLPGLIVGAGKLGQSRATTIVNNVLATRTLPLNVFIGSLGVPHLGRRRAEIIMKAVPGQFDTIDDWLSSTKLIEYADAASIPNIAKPMVDGIAAFKDEIEDLLQFVTIDNKPTAQPVVATGSSCAGRVFCFTGKIEKCDDSGKRYTRSRMQQLILDNGGHTADDVRAGVTDLVQADPNSVSSKTSKAKKLGINVMSESDFFAMVGL